MENLVQIICGAGGQETIEECARVPESLGATIIVVYGLWPQYDYPNGDINFAQTSNLVEPTFNIDDVESIARKRGWHYLRMNKFAFNGEQYNLALDYIQQKRIKCDHIWFTDSDECIDPEHLKPLLDFILLCKSQGLQQVRFDINVEILPEWKYIVTGPIWHGNRGILWGDALKVTREINFDGNYNFTSDVKFVITTVPLFHLHHFRRNCAQRIRNGFWFGGGKSYSISEADFLPNTTHINYLKNKFKNGFYKNLFEIDSYLGPSIFSAERN